MNSPYSAKAMALWLVLTSPLLLSSATAQISDSQRRHEEADIAKLVALTRADNSTIFFKGLTGSGYVRKGEIRRLELKHIKASPPSRCLGEEGVSRDGTRIAYFTNADDARRCRIVLLDLRTGEDRILAETVGGFGVLSWSWDDTEIAYRVPDGIVAMSVKDGRQRTLRRLPLQINGEIAPSGWILHSIGWLHQRPEFVFDAVICVPTKKAGSCEERHHALLVSPDDSRVLGVGAGAAVSPAGDQIAFVAKGSVEIINADGSNRQRIVSIPPAAFYFPFIKEETFWSKLVWSPSGDCLLFNTIINEEFNNNVYLVDVKSRKRRRILKNTSLYITAWR